MRRSVANLTSLPVLGARDGAAADMPGPTPAPCKTLFTASLDRTNARSATLRTLRQTVGFCHLRCLNRRPAMHAAAHGAPEKLRRTVSTPRRRN